MDIFRTTMSLQQFRFILQCLRFDDKSTRAERSKIDKLAPIRDVFEHFVANCRNNYTVGEIVTIDEKLEGFWGKCPFRQYIPSKPRKYGIKIFALADSRTFYSSNLEVYTGKQPEGPYNLSNSADAVVERLISRISGSGRNVTVDNWFNSVPLATRLLKDHNLTLLGTLRKNKKELPPEFVQTKNRQIHSSMFGFNGDITLVSHVPKKGKVVLLLSTMHHDDKIDESTGEQKKPDMITSYNTFKGGVDTVDQMCATYVVSQHREQRATSTSLPGELQMKLKRQATSIQDGHKEEKRRREGKGRGTEIVFENKVLRKIFGAKRDEITGEWRKLHNTELHALYSSPDIIRNIKSIRLRWAGHVARMGESRNALVGRPEGKRPLGRPRRRWEDNIKMDLREVGYDDRDWINLAQDRDQWRAYVRAAMNLRVPYKPVFRCADPELAIKEMDHWMRSLRILRVRKDAIRMNIIRIQWGFD
ncbi:hypothetical protein ANN_05859 [Periplaneta americana]|uniref:PiggyBac transposable element-derived protein domain-containing protein n=1 Tax=Periplaneta americana TaxID=6978 RepID=A0ABQ8TBZ5_PERAM|nr:hypothetical protein ANN_05859 [Periplaneta americana]